MPFAEFEKYLQHFGWIPLVQIFVFLPYFYCVLAIDVHKDYAELIKSTPAGFRLDDKAREEIEADLHIFDLDWWLVITIAALFVGLLLTGVVATSSKALAEPSIEGSISSLPQGETGANAEPCPQTDAGVRRLEQRARSFVRAALGGYALLIGLALTFFIAWERVTAARKLRGYYLRFK